MDIIAFLNQKIRPCYSCGGKAEIYIDDENSVDDGRNKVIFVRCGCRDCARKTAIYPYFIHGMVDTFGVRRAYNEWSYMEEDLYKIDFDAKRGE